MASISTDREGVASFLLEKNGRRVRAMVARRMGPSVRQFFDTDDLVSTVLRRIDRFIAEGKSDFEIEAQLWALVTKVTRREVHRKSDCAAKLRRCLYETRPVPEAVERAGDDLLAEAMTHLRNDSHRQVLYLRVVVGLNYEQIAFATDLTERTARQYMVLAKSTLREKMGSCNGERPAASS